MVSSLGTGARITCPEPRVRAAKGFKNWRARWLPVLESSLCSSG